MMVKARLIFILLVLFAPLKMHASESEDIHSGLKLYTGEEVFKNLPELAQKGRRCFCMIAFLILVGSAISCYNNSKDAETIIRHSLSAMAIGISITFIPQILNWADAFMHEFTNYLNGYGVKHYINKVFKTSRILAITADPINAALDAKSKFTINSVFREIKIWLLATLDRCVRSIIIQTLSGWLWICAVICSVLDAIRYFLAYMSSMILPVFLSGLTTNAFRSQSVNYLYGLLGIICWPIGWAIGHMGTASLFVFSIKILKCGVNASNFDEAGKLEQINSLTNSYNWDIDIANALPILKTCQITTFFAFATMLIFIGFWILLVSISTPYLIQKVVISGGQFFSGLVAGASKSTIKTIGRTAATVFSKIGTALERSKEDGRKSEEDDPKSNQSIQASNSNPTTNGSSRNSIGKFLSKNPLIYGAAKALCAMGYGASRLLEKTANFDGNPAHFSDIISRSDSKRPRT